MTIVIRSYENSEISIQYATLSIPKKIVSLHFNTYKWSCRLNALEHKVHAYFLSSLWISLCFANALELLNVFVQTLHCITDLQPPLLDDPIGFNGRPLLLWPNLALFTDGKNVSTPPVSLFSLQPVTQSTQWEYITSNGCVLFHNEKYTTSTLTVSESMNKWFIYLNVSTSSTIDNMINNEKSYWKIYR